jgi:hypothetical protein
MTEVAEASTPFASAVDLEPDPSEISDAHEADADRPTFVSPWWRRVTAPSRPVVAGALAALVAAGLGWTAGAKPWASHRAHPVLAAKAVAKRSSPSRPAPARAAAAPHPNRRVAVNAKSKPAVGAASKPHAKPAPSVKHLAASGSGASAHAHKATTNKPPSKGTSANKGKALSHASTAKAKPATAHGAKPANKAKPAKPKSLASQ